jgi:hypothetical protein
MNTAAKVSLTILGMVCFLVALSMVLPLLKHCDCEDEKPDIFSEEPIAAHGINGKVTL